MKELNEKHGQATQKPITADEVGEGRLLVQMIFKANGKLFVWNGIGDAKSFALNQPVRAKFVWTIVAAAVSIIASVYGLPAATVEPEPGQAAPDPEPSKLWTPN